MAKMDVELIDGRRVTATYVRHVRTLTTGGRNDDVDLFRYSGREFMAISPANDGRVLPREVEADADHFPGHPVGA